MIMIISPYTKPPCKDVVGGKEKNPIEWGPNLRTVMNERARGGYGRAVLGLGLYLILFWDGELVCE